MVVLIFLLIMVFINNLFLYRRIIRLERQVNQIIICQDYWNDQDRL